MGDVDIRVTGKAGRITLTRPKALNALTYDMCLAIDAALVDWARNDAVLLVIIDAEGDKAFCAGGDIAKLYQTGRAGDFDYGRRFWRDEYRMNARLAHYPKPVVTFLQGFVMGGGVGLGCHTAHRIVAPDTQIAMPECGIGLVPDVGGTSLLARAPGRLGAYLGLTGARMGPGDAIRAGFADTCLPRDDWPSLIAALENAGDARLIPQGDAPDDAPLAEDRAQIDRLFAASTLPAILTALEAGDSALAANAAKAVRRNSPIAMGATLGILDRLAAMPDPDIRTALELEYRYTARAMEHADFLEGIRAQIIDKDRNPNWRHGLDELGPGAVDAMLAPLGEAALTFDTREGSA